ncbi:MAG: MlaD family protein [Solirubrobacterales bacterium]
MKRQGVADNPVLVGAGAILLVLVMVLFSYNAHKGLPFVPTYDIKAAVPSGANVVTGNDVRIGGARVGLVTSITPARNEGEKPYAILSLKLDEKIGPIPTDSLIEVRPRSTIGLKYVELTLGKSNEDLPDGSTLPIKQAVYATEFEDLLNTFDEKVREGNRKSLREFGNAFAGRGADLNTAFGEIGPLFENLEPVARTISDPGTRLADFIRAIAQAATDTANAGSAAGDVWTNANRTFAAFAVAAQGIEESIAESPSTLAVFTEEFPKQRPYIRQLTTLVKEFQPGSKYLPQVADDMATIVTRGTPAFKHFSRTNPKLTKTFNTLGDFAEDPGVQMGVQGLATFVQVINEPLQTITPAQTVCNYAGLLARNVASSVSNRGGIYGWLRVGLVAGYAAPGPAQNAEVGPASGLANYSAPNLESNFLHANAAPSTGANGICGPGNELSLGEKRPPNRTLTQSPTTTEPALKKGTGTEDTAAVDQGALKK